MKQSNGNASPSASPREISNQDPSLQKKWTTRNLSRKIIRKAQSPEDMSFALLIQRQESKNYGR